jgi:hypothetical protein
MTCFGGIGKNADFAQALNDPFRDVLWIEGEGV